MDYAETGAFFHQSFTYSRPRLRYLKCAWRNRKFANGGWFAYHAEFVEDHPRLSIILKVVNWLAVLMAARESHKNQFR